MALTKIEWCNATWNPIAGCTKVSAGCENCWAINIARRLQAKGIAGYEGVTDKSGWTGQINLILSKLSEPLSWKKPKRIFVCSRCDLFHPDVPNSFIRNIYHVMKTASWHTFIVLTKWPERVMSALQNQPWQNGLPNVWHLVTCENQEMANQRIPELLKLRDFGNWPVLGVSAEPLLGLIEFHKWMNIPSYKITKPTINSSPFGNATYLRQISYINYVIIGGERGPRARPCDVENIRSIVQQCKASDTPCFVKQLGAKPFSSKLCMEIKLNHSKGADPAEWPEDLRVREFPK